MSWDFEGDEGFEGGMNFWFEALNPLNKLDLFREPSLLGLYQAAAVAGVGTTTMILAGAGSSMYNPYTIQKGLLVKVDFYRSMAVTAGKGAKFTARSAVRSSPLVAAYFAVSGYFGHLASLDWVPDLYQAPGGR